jgi:hypothetical protein
MEPPFTTSCLADRIAIGGNALPLQHAALPGIAPVPRQTEKWGKIILVRWAELAAQTKIVTTSGSAAPTELARGKRGCRPKATDLTPQRGRLLGCFS